MHDEPSVTATLTITIAAPPGATNIEIFSAFVLELQNVYRLAREQLQKTKELIGPTDPPEGD